MDSILLTGLWVRKDKNGNEIMVGSLGPTLQIVIFESTKYTSKKDPDYLVYLKKVKKDEKPEY